MIRSATLMLVALLLGVLPLGCGDASKGLSYVDGAAPTFHVGWLGARVQPLTRDLTVHLDAKDHVPGGVVVRELDAGQPLAAAGARVGDVVVRVDDTWMPLKRDMHIELMRLVEQSVSAGLESVPIRVWRAGALVALSLRADLPPIETGLPVSVVRFDASAARALEQPVPDDASPATWALVGLACIASSSSDVALREKAASRVRAAVELDATPTRDLAWALLFEAEQVGPLPAEFVLAARPEGSGAASAPGPGTAPPPGMTGPPIQMTPEQLKALLEKLKAGGGTVVEMGGAQPLPGNRDEPGTPEAAGGAVAVAPAPQAAALLEKYASDRIPALEQLGAVAELLTARQAENGGWAPTGGAETDAETTSLALWALAAVLRVGGDVAAEPIGKGLGHLHETLHAGRLSIEVAKGADRRVEAGRAALASVALRALGCPDSDEMQRALSTFSDAYGARVHESTRDPTTFLIATAVARRSRGLATWSTFYEDFRFLLVAAERPSGAFVPFDADDDAFGSAASATAACALLLALQGERVPVLLSKAENPLAPRFDSSGKALESGAAAAPPGAGAPPDAVLEMLKGMGVEIPGAGK